MALNLAVHLPLQQDLIPPPHHSGPNPASRRSIEQNDDYIRMRLRFTQHSHRVVPRQALPKLEPIAQELHVSSQALLTFIFIGITILTIAFAVGVYAFHKRHHQKQYKYTDRQCSSLGAPGASDENDEGAFSSGHILQPPGGSYLIRVGRKSWTGQCSSRQGIRFDVGEKSIHHEKSPIGVDPPTTSPKETSACAYDSQYINVLKIPDTCSPASSKAPSPAPTFGYGPPHEPPVFTITDEGGFEHSGQTSSEGREEEDEVADLYDDYGQADDIRDSLASYYYNPKVEDKRSLLSPVMIDKGHSWKTQSTFSFGGLVDMYGSGSPTMGMGSPSSPSKRFSRWSARLSQGTLTPSGGSKRLTWKQPAISPTQAGKPLRSSPYAFATPSNSGHPGDSPSFYQPEIKMSNQPSPPPARSSSPFRHLTGHITSPTSPPEVTPPMPTATPPPLPPQFRVSRTRSSPPPVPIVIPAVPPKVPTSGTPVPVRRRLRGVSLYGEIMRMTTKR